MESTKNILIHKILVRTSLILLSSILYACGGGGDAGGGGGGDGTPTYTYKTFTDTISEASSPNVSAATFEHWDYFASAYHFRGPSPGGYLCWYPSTSATFKEEFVSVNPLNYNLSIQYGAQSGATFYGGFQGCAGADVSGAELKVSSSNINSTSEFSFNNTLSGLLTFDHDEIGIVDSTNLSETVLRITSLNQELTSNWSGTSYVTMAVGYIDYADECNYSSQTLCSSIKTDNSHEGDWVGVLTGDATFSGDMPSSGTKSYRTKAMSAGIYGLTNYLNNSTADSYSLGCGASPSFNECKLITIYSASAENILAFDFSAESLTGTLSFAKHFTLNYSSHADLNSADSSKMNEAMGNLVFQNLTVSGNSFSGTASNTTYQGAISGYFYGPQAAEIGAVITLRDKQLVATWGATPNQSSGWTTIVLAGAQ